MGKLKGIEVVLIDEVSEGHDPFGAELSKEIEIIIPNVLVAPSSADDVTNSISVYGRKAVYTLGIPKEDTHIWENKKVRFFGETWRVFGIPLKGIDELIPLKWNKKVMVERYE